MAAASRSLQPRIPEGEGQQQVMSPMMGAIPEGSEAEPNYGATDVGVCVPMSRGQSQPALPNGVVPLGVGQCADPESASVRGSQEPLIAQGARASSGSFATLALDEAGTSRALVFTGLGARDARPTEALTAAAEPQQGQHHMSHTATVAQPQQAPETTQLPEPVLQAVRQLAEQQQAVAEAVQGRAHAGQRQVPQEPPPPLPDGLRREGSSGAWGTWTRVSEVLHRRVVSPVMEQVGVSRTVASSPAQSQPWQTPTASPSPQTPLMSPEIRRAMQSWASRPSLLNPRPPPAHRDDSSSGSLPQEVIVEEVRRQVQLALHERDKELEALKGENSELKKALEQSALTLSTVLQQAAGEGVPGPRALRGDPSGSQALELCDNSRGEGLGASGYRGPPPGLYGVSSEPGATLPGRDEGGQRPTRSFLKEAAGRLFGHDGTQAGNEAREASWWPA